MTIQQIRYVIGIAEAGSFNRAASEKLFISQPSLTSSIRDLEDELGFKIFVRSAKGAALTQEGEHFLSDASAVYRSYESLLEKYARGNKKSFSVSTLHYPFATKAFVGIVKRFSPEGYRFAIRELKISEVIEDVASRRSEIGLIYLSDLTRAQTLSLLESKGLEFRHLTECSAFVRLAKGHPLAKKESLSLGELSPYPCVTYEHDDLAPFFSKDVLARREFQQAIRTVDRATVLNLLKELNGYTFSSGVVEEQTDDGYIAIPLKNLGDNAEQIFELGYVAEKNTRVSNIALCYIDDIRRALHIAGFAC